MHPNRCGGRRHPAGGWRLWEAGRGGGFAVITLAAALVASACSGQVEQTTGTPSPREGDINRPPGSTGPGSSGPGTPGANGPATPGAPGVTGLMGGAVPGGPGGLGTLGPGEFLPARVRRLSNAELEASIAALLGSAPAALIAGLAPDTRQSGFTANAGQRVDPLLVAQLEGVAIEAAKTGAPKLLTGLGCSAGDDCARKVIADFGLRAYRRPLLDVEKTDLFAVFQAGAAGGSFVDGVELVIATMLQAPSFLYINELGAAPRDGRVTLSPYEVASVLAYFATDAPPDAALLDAAAKGELALGAARLRHAERLLATASAKPHLRRMIKEWLGLDRLDQTGKDAKVYPQFEALRPAMAKESDDVIDEVLAGTDASVNALLSADFTIVDAKLGTFYGLKGAKGRTSLMATPRRGLLLQSGFLAVHASDHESGPIKRGATILRQVLCTTLPNPSELNITVVPPTPDPALTTRERFAVHSKDPACAVCHQMIDGIGFALEAFDGMGGFRDKENGKPINTVVDLAGPLQGAADGALALVDKLVAAEATQGCFARNLFRYVAGQAGEAYESKFLRDVYLAQPANTRNDVKRLMAAYAGSDAFVTRRIEP